MSDVPEDPETFFSVFLAQRFESASPDLAGFSSIGSVLFRVTGVGEWSLRIGDGALECVREMEDDVVLQITVAPSDFPVLFVEPARRLGADRPLPRQTAALRRLLGNAETSRLVRRVPGSVLVALNQGDRRCQLLVTAGRRRAEVESAECTVELDFDDWNAAEAGSVSLSDLFVKGKLRIRGNVQIAMALAGALS